MYVSPTQPILAHMLVTKKQKKQQQQQQQANSKNIA